MNKHELGVVTVGDQYTYIGLAALSRAIIAYRTANHAGPDHA